MTIQEAIDYINHHNWSQWKLGLDRTRELLHRLGDPQKNLRFVHVAGSNGKGSTCAMLERILREAGYRTGLFPSPYIEDFRERIQVSGEYITEEALCEITDRVRQEADAMEDHPSQFELITAIGMLYFDQAKCDIVVLEVGLGGEFDATNVIDPPEAAVITHIGLEHTQYLGDTLAAIARTKSGIIKTGADVVLYENDAEVMDVVEAGNRIVTFFYAGVFEEILDALGQMPLPPYITHALEDRTRYNTVYAKLDGSAAAPTAGLHFTKELLEEIRSKGVQIAELTLHVGLGTFRPVKVDDVETHHMHTEHCMITPQTAKLINDTHAAGHRVIAVGTTSCRTLESMADEDGTVRSGEMDTSIFIYPGYRFKVMDALITNFHLPESTLVMLVSAFAGKDKIMAAYEEAVRERYRFFSFGDAMYIY